MRMHLIRRLAATALLAATLVTLPAGPAAAQDNLVSSYPAAGAVVGKPPRIVTLRLGAAATRAAVRVADGCGRPVPGTVVVAGDRVSVRLDENHEHGQRGADGVGAGQWQVNWQVVDAEGRPAEGNVPFTVSGTARCEVPPQPSPAADGAGNGGGTDETPTGAAGSGAGEDVRRAASVGVSSNDRFPVVPVAAVFAVTILLVGGQLLRRRRAAGSAA